MFSDIANQSKSTLFMQRLLQSKLARGPLQTPTVWVQKQASVAEKNRERGEERSKLEILKHVFILVFIQLFLLGFFRLTDCKRLWPYFFTHICFFYGSLFFIFVYVLLFVFVIKWQIFPSMWGAGSLYQNHNGMNWTGSHLFQICSHQYPKGSIFIYDICNIFGHKDTSSIWV